MGHLCDTWDDEHLDQLWHETRGTKMKRPLRAVPMCCRFMLKPPLYHVSNSIPLLGKIPQLCRVPAEECRVQSSSLCAKVQQAADSSRNCWCGLENQTQNSTFLQTSPHVCPLQIPVPSISIFTSLQDLTKRSPSPSNKWLLQRISKCSCYIYICATKKKTKKCSCLCEDTERPCAAPRSSGDREGGTPLRGKHGGPANNVGTTWDGKMWW